MTVSPTLHDSPTLRAAPPQQTIDAAGATAIGQKRTRNEDQFLVATVQRGLRVRASSLPASELPQQDDATLLVVADGMGGHDGGDLASALAVRSISHHLCSMIPGGNLPRGAQRDSIPEVRRGLVSAVAHSNDEVRRAASAEGGVLGMGTTLTIAYLYFPVIYVAHVGDSPCYLWRRGELFRLTRDHTVAEELRTRLGDQVAADSSWHHMLTKAIGIGDDSEASPEVRRAELWPDDVVLLCSDGVTKHVGDDDIASFLASSRSAADLSAAIVATADERGGTDNITAVVARVVTGPTA